MRVAGSMASRGRGGTPPRAINGGTAAGRRRRSPPRPARRRPDSRRVSWRAAGRGRRRVRGAQEAGPFCARVGGARGSVRVSMPLSAPGAVTLLGSCKFNDQKMAFCLNPCSFILRWSIISHCCHSRFIFVCIWRFLTFPSRFLTAVRIFQILNYYMIVNIFSQSYIVSQIYFSILLWFLSS